MSQRTQERADLLRPRRKDNYQKTYDWLVARPTVLVLAIILMIFIFSVCLEFVTMPLSSVGAG